ncbi:MAG TPA: hypothetical protein VJ747_11765 [Stellaceae bacterium]|jgi:hypothetical protein|nr:hypothetical protein [Stellaceae bacterium]
MPRAADRSGGSESPIAGVLSAAALDERWAIVGTSGSGKTYTGKGLVEHLLEAGARLCVIDPLGVWWGMRAGADSVTPGYPVVVFGGRHADVMLDERMGAALGGLIGTRQLACVVDLSELGSSAARRRFMTAFAESLYETNTEPLHLVLDEADLWAPQRPLPEAHTLLGRIEEIVRRGRVRGFVPWLITQRPAVVHKDVLSQADILVAMKLTSSQDRDAVGGWIEGQADRAEGKRILADLPKLSRGEGYLWAPSDDVLARVAFPKIRTFDSSRAPKRGERVVTPRTLAEVDLSAITAALVEAGVARSDDDAAAGGPHRRRTELERQLVERDRQLTAAQARIVCLEAEAAALRARLGQIASLAAETASLPAALRPSPRPSAPAPEASTAPAAQPKPADNDGTLHPAARKLLSALAQHAPARFSWGQAATLAGLKPSGGHYNAGRKQLRDLELVEEAADLVTVSPSGLDAAGEVPPVPSSAEERLALWCSRLPSPAPEMLRALAVQGERYFEPAELADALGKKATGGHWNSGVALLRNNGLVEMSGKRMRVSELFR